MKLPKAIGRCDDLGNIGFSFSVSEIEDFDTDVKKELKRIFSMPVIGNSLISVRTDMAQNLKEHIQKDVYDRYKPRVYKRRSKNPELGIPLINIDEGKGQARYMGMINPEALRASIAIDYYPTGKHKEKAWSGFDGDELIRRIETGTPPYKWRPNFDPIERPFWQNFVEEQIDRGEALDSFIREMALRGEEIIDDGSGVVREPEDGTY